MKTQVLIFFFFPLASAKTFDIDFFFVFYSFTASGLILKTKWNLKLGGVGWNMSPIKSLGFDGLAYSDLKSISSETTVYRLAAAVGIWWQWSTLNKYVSVMGQMKNTTAGTHRLSHQSHHLIGTGDDFSY